MVLVLADGGAGTITDLTPGCPYQLSFFGVCSPGDVVGPTGVSDSSQCTGEHVILISFVLMTSKLKYDLYKNSYKKIVHTKSSIAL